MPYSWEKFKYQNGLIDFMKFTKEKYNETFHIYASNKGKHTEVVIGVCSREKVEHFYLDIDEAIDMATFLNDAITDAQRRATLSEED